MVAQEAKPLRLFYVRHGETEWALSGKHTGKTDVPLTKNGEAGAQALQPLLGRYTFDHVLSSPRTRAYSTCVLAGYGDGVQIDPDLAEWDYGDYEGLRSAEIKNGRPDWSVFRDGCPNGESPDEMTARVDRVIARLSMLGGNIALFSHGHFGGALATRWLDLKMAEGEHFPLQPASLSILGPNPSHPDVRVLSMWNVLPHLVA
ncbi:histidine phosphatase family protein [Methylovirgula sp. 4M-Z18]|uniref:histidine phosphatase family protein n=1 Tax=Methylovirgula sp. 4M-Z18 TaxID=2293567 RepID=UPI000E2EF8B8|nr:histidine phosphatase family protein [Methylovirgula sp. 4M-Z18]RFB78353.1 histidine phosphatase family protein [Methylovirgula sp. 4M-Z18]